MVEKKSISAAQSSRTKAIRSCEASIARLIASCGGLPQPYRLVGTIGYQKKASRPSFSNLASSAIFACRASILPRLGSAAAASAANDKSRRNSLKYSALISNPRLGQVDYRYRVSAAKKP